MNRNRSRGRLSLSPMRVPTSRTRPIVRIALLFVAALMIMWLHLMWTAYETSNDINGQNSGSQIKSNQIDIRQLDSHRQNQEFHQYQENNNHSDGVSRRVDTVTTGGEQTDALSTRTTTTTTTTTTIGKSTNGEKPPIDEEETKSFEAVKKGKNTDGEENKTTEDGEKTIVTREPDDALARKHRLEFLAKLVRKFHDTSKTQDRGIHSMSTQDREKIILNIQRLRDWLNASAGIDTHEIRTRSVLKVARMVLKKTCNPPNPDIDTMSIEGLVGLTNTSSFSKIKEAVNRVPSRLNTDWLRDPVKWPKWSGNSPKARPQGNTRPALVLPFHDGDIPRFGSFFARWGEIHLSGRYRKSSAMAMIMAYNGNLDHPDQKHTKDLIVSLWKSFIAPSNNGPELYFLSLNQPPQLNHFDGAAASFYQLAGYLPKYFFSMILMETDITPVTQGSWFSELDDDHRPRSCEYWVEGSASNCDPWEYGDIALRKDYHINGNAIYVIGCTGYQTFLQKVRQFYPPQAHLKGCCCEVMGGCETFEPAGYEYGYDHAQYQFRMQPENLMYARHILSKFRYTHTILNQCEHSTTDFYGNITIPVDTVMVHSKYALLSKQEKMINEITVEVFGRKPHPWEVDEFYPPLKSGEIDRDELINQFCSGAEYQSNEIPVEVCEGRDTATRWADRMKDKVYVWSVDFHSGPSHCNQLIFKDAGGVLHCETDYGMCNRHGMCPRRLHMLQVSNNLGFALKSPVVSNPTTFINRFHELYRFNKEFARVDAFVCSHPVANCELFVPFKKPLIIYATTRLEFGRHDKYIDWRLSDWTQDEGKERWNDWLQTLHNLAKNPINVIAANSKYDQNYIKYFTGLDVQLIPSWCGDQSDTMQRILNRKGGCQGDELTSYAPYRNTILIGPYRTNLERTRFNKTYKSEKDHPILKELLKKGNTTEGNRSVQIFELLSERYSNGYYTSDLTAHPAMVFIPYQVSTIFTFEVYRLNIPLFFPDLHLLTKWWQRYGIMWERSYGDPERPTNGSLAKKLPHWPSPNKNTTKSFTFWMQYCDWYQLPHIQLYSSFADLMSRLRTANLTAISDAMKKQNNKDRKGLVRSWKSIFDKIRKYNNRNTTTTTISRPVKSSQHRVPTKVRTNKSESTMRRRKVK